MTAPREAFAAATAAFDRENARDPNRIEVDGVRVPRELAQAERLSAWIERLDPDASEALRLAARCQHLRRWEIPRSTFPEGRTGYLQWRTRLARFHAAEAEKILSAAGYPPELIAKVARINTKQAMKSDPDVQTMEDALCLSFLEHELDEFAARHEPDKVVNVLRKTWKKMSERARREALALAPRLSERARQLIAQIE